MPMRTSATHGGPVGTASACSRRPATTGCRACRSLVTGSRSPRRTRWPTTSTPTPGTSTCRYGPASRSTASSGHRAGEPGSWSRPATRPSRQPRSSWPAAPTAHPRVPGFAADLDPAILQLHSSEYRRPAQLRDGPVLVVGAANSGAEIAHDIARSGGRRTWLVGRDTGHLPFDIEGRARPVARSRDLVRRQPHPHRAGARSVAGRASTFLAHGHPVERVKPANLAAAGVERVFSRVSRGHGTVGRCSTTAPSSTWPTSSGAPASGPTTGGSNRRSPMRTGGRSSQRGVVAGHRPGCTSSGSRSSRRSSSALIGGVGRDAAFVAARVAERAAMATSRAGAPAIQAGTAG